MVEFDLTIVVQIISFLILMTLLNNLFFKPMLKVMGEREEFLDGSAKTIQSKRQEIEEQQQTYQKKLTDARQSAHELITHQIQQAKSEKDEMLAVVSEETSKKLQNAKDKMNTEADATRKILSKEVDLAADLIFSKLTNIKSDATETAPELMEATKGA